MHDSDSEDQDDEELLISELASESSRFIDCNGLSVHYVIEFPQASYIEVALYNWLVKGAFQWLSVFIVN